MPIDFGKDGPKDCLRGRAVKNRKGLVDGTHVLDIATLRAQGVFESGPGVVWQQKPWLPSLFGPHDPLRIAYKLTKTDTGDPVLKVAHRSGYSGKVSSTPIRLTWTRPHYGGRRWWFQCPLVIDGRACGRRCAKLHLLAGGHFFGCRICQRLTYRSRQWHRDRIYEGLVRPHELMKEMVIRPPWTLSDKQRRRRRRQIANGIAGMERIIGSGEDT